MADANQTVQTAVAKTDDLDVVILASGLFRSPFDRPKPHFPHECACGGDQSPITSELLPCDGVEKLDTSLSDHIETTLTIASIYKKVQGRLSILRITKHEELLSTSYFW